MKSGKTNETLYKNPVKLGKTRKLDHKPYRGTKYQKDTHAQKKEQLNSTATDGSRFLCQRRKKERKTTEEENGKKQKKIQEKWRGREKEKPDRCHCAFAVSIISGAFIHSFIHSFSHARKQQKKTSSKATCFFFSFASAKEKRKSNACAAHFPLGDREKNLNSVKKKKLGKISLGTVNRTQ